MAYVLTIVSCYSKQYFLQNENFGPKLVNKLVFKILLNTNRLIVLNNTFNIVNVCISFGLFFA